MAGGWGVTSSWQRNMSFMQFLTKCDDFCCLQQMAAGTDFRYKAHAVPSKCEFEGHIHGETDDMPDANLLPIPHLHTDEILRVHWVRGQQQATADATRLGVHLNVPPAIWNRPWEHDPPCRETVNYLRAHPGSDDSESEVDSNDDSDSSDDSSDEDGGDRVAATADPCVATGRDALTQATNISVETDINFDQFEYAACLLRDESSPEKPNSLLTLPTGCQISKRSAVVKLREAYGQDKSISRTRLQRIEQLAASAKQEVDKCGSMVGEKFELHDNLAFAIKGTGSTVQLRFGRVKKMVATTNGRQSDKIYAIPADDAPTDLVFVLQLYKTVRPSETTFAYNDSPPQEINAENILGHVCMQFNNDTGEFTIDREDFISFNGQVQAMQEDLRRKNERRVRIGAQRQDRHRQEARALARDRSSRYRDDTSTMTLTRRERASKRTGTTILHTERGRALEVGMCVRLYHEVRAQSLSVVYVH